MKDYTEGVAIEEFVGLKAKMESVWIDNNEHKKVKCVNRNVVETINHNENKNVFLNSKYIRHSMNRIQSTDHKIVKK